MRIAFATAPADAIGHDDTDRPLHDAACAAVGIELAHPVWSDPDVPWDEFDLVVVRATWDYLDHLDAYRAWLGRVDAVGRLHNPGRVVTWNLDKRYLLELSDAGVPIVPTRVCGDAGAVDAALDAVGGEVVVKPVESAGSRATGRFGSGDPAARELALSVLGAGTAVLVQPAVASVAERGEVSTLVFDGQVSHSVRKGPLLALGGGLVGGTYTERLTAEPVTPARRALAERVVATAAAAAGGGDDDAPLLYARVDTVVLDDGTEAVLEVELAEPSFFLTVDPSAAGRFTAAVARRVAAGR